MDLQAVVSEVVDLEAAGSVVDSGVADSAAAALREAGNFFISTKQPQH